MDSEGLGSLLNSLLARQAGLSIHEDPFTKVMNPMGMINTSETVSYGPPNPPEERRIGDMSGGFEEQPKKNENSIQLGNLEINPRVNYSTSDMSRGISGLRDMLYNSGYGGNFNYKFGDSGFSLLGNYGKSRSNEDRQYRDYPSNSNVNSTTNRDFTLKYGREFEPGGGLSSLFR